MAEGARERGYEYLAITDHSATHGFGNHVDARPAARSRSSGSARSTPTLRRLRPADRDRDEHPPGRLARLRRRAARASSTGSSPPSHTSFNMCEQDMTARMVAAIEHPLVDVIGHPTGRKIETRAPYAIDMEQVIEAAARTHTMLEINAAPDRRDLNELHARAAAAAGRADRDRLRRALGAQPRADAYGVATARRAWLTPDAGRQHAPLGGAGTAAQAEPRRRMSVDSPVEDRRRGARAAFRDGVRAGAPFALAGGAAGDVVRRARARRRDAGLGARS